MSRRTLRHLVVCAGLACSAAIAACGAPTDVQPSSGGPHVVATTTVLGDLLRTIVGGDGTVEVLMEAGQDPHGFALSARQAGSLRDADLVVANGLRLEESMLDALDAAEADGVAVLRVADQLDPIPYAGDAHADDGEGHDDEHDGDPHVWYDPVRMAEGVRLMATAIAAVDDAHPAATWIDRGEDLAAALVETNEQVQSILAVVDDRCRVLVTNHDSFGYFAARYGFRIVGTVVPGTSGQAEPSAREFADLVRTVRDSGVPAIFAETSQPARLATTLATEVGTSVQVVTLYTDALGPAGSGADTYRGMLVTNARRIADALSSC